MTDPGIRWSLFDRALAAISPARGLQRMSARAQIHVLSRAYEGASKGRGTQGWRTSRGSADAEIAMAAAPLRDRMRDLVRNDATAANAVSVLVNAMVGPGIRPRAKSGNKARDKKADKLWAEWSRSCDADGLTDFHGVLALAVREMIEGGDAFVIRQIQGGAPRGRVPLRVKVLEADHLDGSRITGTAGPRIVDGIEFDATGRRTGFWLFDQHPGDIAILPGASLASRRVPAQAVAHLFERQRCQNRGVPWGTPAIRMLRDIGDWQNAELVRKKMEACVVGIVSSDDENTVAGLVKDAKGNDVERFTPGMLAYAKGATRVDFSTPASVGGVYEWHSVMQHIVAAGFRVPYELLTGDLKQVNFSSSRVGINNFRRTIEAAQWTVIIPMLCERVWQWFCEAAHLAGLLDTADVPVEWAPPRMESVNPWQDAQTDLVEVRAGFATRSQKVAMRGYDPEEVLEEWRTDAEASDAADLTFDSDPRRVTQAGLFQSLQRPASPGGDAQE